MRKGFLAIISLTLRPQSYAATSAPLEGMHRHSYHCKHGSCLHSILSLSLTCCSNEVWRVHRTGRVMNITWILGDADAAQFLSGEYDRRDALVQLGITELWEDALGDLCQHSTCKQACQNLSHCKDNHQRLHLVAVSRLSSPSPTQRISGAPFIHHEIHERAVTSSMHDMPWCPIAV